MQVLILPQNPNLKITVAEAVVATPPLMVGEGGAIKVGAVASTRPTMVPLKQTTQLGVSYAKNLVILFTNASAGFTFILNLPLKETHRPYSFKLPGQ